MILLACPELHIIDAVPMNLSLNHNLLRQMGDDLTSAFAKKALSLYLTININVFIQINTQVYIFKPAYLVNIAC